MEYSSIRFETLGSVDVVESEHGQDDAVAQGGGGHYAARGEVDVEILFVSFSGLVLANFFLNIIQPDGWACPSTAFDGIRGKRTFSSSPAPSPGC